MARSALAVAGTGSRGMGARTAGPRPVSNIQALTSAPSGSLGSYHIELEEGQRLYLYWEP